MAVMIYLQQAVRLAWSLTEEEEFQGRGLQMLLLL